MSQCRAEEEYRETIHYCVGANDHEGPHHCHWGHKWYVHEDMDWVAPIDMPGIMEVPD